MESVLKLLLSTRCKDHHRDELETSANIPLQHDSNYWVVLVIS